jgi:hypothetical protein
METCAWRHQTENGSRTIFLNPFTVCSSFSNGSLSFVCLMTFIDEETNGSYLFADGLNGLACLYMYVYEYKYNMRTCTSTSNFTS